MYVHIRYGVFVALDIFGGAKMAKVSKIKLLFACYRLAGMTGLLACCKYLCGRIVLDEIPLKSSDFSGGAAYE